MDKLANYEELLKKRRSSGRALFERPALSAPGSKSRASVHVLCPYGAHAPCQYATWKDIAESISLRI